MLEDIDSQSTFDSGSGLHGRWVRISVYFQIIAYLLGYLNVARLQVRTQLCGFILTTTLLAQWLDNMRHISVDAARLFVGLALAMALVNTGSLLLMLTLASEKRRHLNQENIEAKREAKGHSKNTDGLFLGICSAILPLTLALAANVWFFYALMTSYADAEAWFSDEDVWVFGTLLVDHQVFKGLVGFHMIMSALLHIPAIAVLAGAALGMIKAYRNTAGDKPVVKTLSQGSIIKYYNFLIHSKPGHYVLLISCYLYSFFLALFAEMTLREASMSQTTAEARLADPSQLTPFILGCMAVISAISDLLKGHPYPGTTLSDSMAVELDLRQDTETGTRAPQIGLGFVAHDASPDRLSYYSIRNEAAIFHHTRETPPQSSYRNSV